MRQFDAYFIDEPPGVLGDDKAANPVAAV